MENVGSLVVVSIAMSVRSEWYAAKLHPSDRVSLVLSKSTDPVYRRARSHSTIETPSPIASCTLAACRKRDCAMIRRLYSTRISIRILLLLLNSE